VELRLAGILLARRRPGLVNGCFPAN